ncbi:MAG: nucleotide pyrophosphohydrolase [Bdellovibrionaceae bacterium]|nr:nucleotide pyrophosphohydrolase [Pseudobdellovibrionaceae bacterium]
MSDASTTIESLKQNIQAFCEERDWDQFHDPKELAIGLITEASELLEHFRFRSPAEVAERLREPSSREEIEDELADVLFFILRFAGRNEIDLSTTVRRKMDKNGRKYPVALAKGSNRKYTEF